ncbi:hypothetical protein [Paraburkholderia sediminicola]|uniref:hypothetical protein n=1 Tax=Paraburkholderia sediminicola TaxID=458836 RepID=UPI0038BDCF65
MASGAAATFVVALTFLVPTNFFAGAFFAIAVFVAGFFATGFSVLAAPESPTPLTLQ